MHVPWHWHEQLSRHQCSSRRSSPPSRFRMLRTSPASATRSSWQNSDCVCVCVLVCVCACACVCVCVWGGGAMRPRACAFMTWWTGRRSCICLGGRERVRRSACNVAHRRSPFPPSLFFFCFFFFFFFLSFLQLGTSAMLCHIADNGNIADNG